MPGLLKDGLMVPVFASIDKPVDEENMPPAVPVNITGTKELFAPQKGEPAYCIVATGVLCTVTLVEFAKSLHPPVPFNV